jgi:hypothetical protein
VERANVLEHELATRFSGYAKRARHILNVEANYSIASSDESGTPAREARE